MCRGENSKTEATVRRMDSSACIGEIVLTSHICLPLLLHRTERNMYMFLRELGTQYNHSTSTLTPNTLAYLLQLDFLIGAILYVGGAPNSAKLEVCKLQIRDKIYLQQSALALYFPGNSFLWSSKFLWVCQRCPSQRHQSGPLGRESCTSL